MIVPSLSSFRPEIQNKQEPRDSRAHGSLPPLYGASAKPLPALVLVLLFLGFCLRREFVAHALQSLFWVAQFRMVGQLLNYGANPQHSRNVVDFLAVYTLAIMSGNANPPQIFLNHLRGVDVHVV